MVPLASFVGCGDEGLARELFGTWDQVSIEALGFTDCPGEIWVTDTEIILTCGTLAHTFNADGTFVSIWTTDEFGDPYNWRREGTWSTEGSTLTLTTTKEGRDGDNLQRLHRPRTSTQTWSVSGDTLTLSVELTGWHAPGYSHFRKRSTP